MSELPPLRPQAPEPSHSSFDPRRPRAPFRFHLQVEAENTANGAREEKALLSFYYQSFEKIDLVLNAILEEIRGIKQEIGRGNVSSIECTVKSLLTSMYSATAAGQTTSKKALDRPLRLAQQLQRPFAILTIPFLLQTRCVTV